MTFFLVSFQGEIVEYTLNITANGYSASYVTGPGGRPVMGAEQAIVQARSVDTLLSEVF
jgi:hypothetical protein